MITLYSYWRSTAAYRVRIALNLKDIKHRIVPVDLIKDGGEQHQAAYREINPHGLVPALVTEAGEVLTQSLAIIEYLEEVHPDNPLLPEEPAARAQARAMALSIACDVHPLNNLRVLQYLRAQDWSDAQVDDWYQRWVRLGFTALEQQLDARECKYACCDHPTVADVCLVAQVYNARRFNVPLDAFPNIREIDGHCAGLSAFDRASPDNQPRGD